MYGIWFIPLMNLIMPLTFYVDYEISTRKQDIKHSRFINWFFVGVNYKTNQEIKNQNEFDHMFQSEHKIEHNVERDLTNPFNNK